MAELDPATAFRGAIMRGADLRREDLSGFDFTGANFAGADLSEADLSLTIGLTTDMLVGAHYNARTRFPAYLPDPFWAPEQRATWADDWGTDQYGRWVSFSVPAAEGTLVTQRMRWIPPGSFLRGSPNDKPGRNDDEGRRREVTIADGFWLFDTPCTQALWQAVMGDNPSRFQSPTRPVEQVSFHDAQAFVTKLNALKPGLSLDLPSEARWEYACRAGTVEATYAGGMQILGEYNAPVLDAIAWYGGNSGVGFELDNGYYSGDWPGKQYEHTRAGTHPVGQKVPNQWGLHDMLGNVWEWCADHWHGSYTGAPDDGSAWLGRRGAAFRVVRGGSWGVGARVVRAARRNRVDPALRAGNLGFRCARVQGNSEAPAAKRRAGRSKPRERSERAATTSPKRPR
ncbi:MAG: SUMF1/EgtB/PvdO family nonheme iron enzyme [Acetobacteraceae bacterium]